MTGFCPLASGSKGNAIYLGTEKTKILIDAGLSFKELSGRLLKIGESIDAIRAILITHEHMDHIEALKMIAEKKHIPVFCNAETAKGIYRTLKVLPDFQIFSSNESFAFHDLTVLPFSIQHDTLDPVGFVVRYKHLKLGFCTDLGLATTGVQKQLAGCHYLYLEANHDLGQLAASPRPESLKKRIASRQGHLSNDEAFRLLGLLLHPGLKHIFLAHLSQECNSRMLLEEKLRAFLQEKNSPASFEVAWQEKISGFVPFT
ncbi:MAG: MBL fold metallo-hydrolase [Parachlamydiales bacterium]|jgi:phosphoribosyl 1,2-cyclic phosphodiesterase